MTAAAAGSATTRAVWDHRWMVRHRFPAAVATSALLALLAFAPGAGAVGMSESYPRVIATTGTGEGVRLTRMEAKVAKAGRRVRVTVRLAGASVAGSRKLSITVAPCTVTTKTYKESYDAPDAPSRPTCEPVAARVVAVTEAPFSLTRVFTIPRPATDPGALRVRVGVPVSGTTVVPPCTGFVEVCGVKATGDLLLNGNTWQYRPGTWWGITAQPPAGVTLDRIVFRSRLGGWVTTSAAAAKVVTTWGYAGEPAAKTRTTPLKAGAQKTLMRNSAFGGEFQTRPTIRVLDYAASIDGRRLFTVKVPLPVWRSSVDSALSRAKQQCIATANAIPVQARRRAALKACERIP